MTTPKLGDSIRSLENRIRLDFWHDCEIQLSRYCDRKAVAEIQVVADDESAWQVLIGEQSCKVVQDHQAVPDVILTFFSSRDWLGIFAGDHSVWDLLDQGRLTIAGDHSVFHALYLLGLLSPSHDFVTPPYPEWARAYKHACVLQHFVSGSEPDHAKWRYFQLREWILVTLPPVKLSTLRRAAGTGTYSKDLREHLWAVFWLEKKASCLWPGLPGLAAVAGVLSALVAWWLPLLLVPGLLALGALAGYLLLGPIVRQLEDRRGETEAWLRDCAWDDPSFFKFVIEEGIVRIDYDYSTGGGF